MKRFIFLLLSIMAISGYHDAGACTRVVYKGNDSLIIVGRSLDWKTPIPTNLYVYPRGIEKQSSDRPGAIRWTSKYGSVYAVGYDGGVTEGMNEKGLTINGLFCKGTIYVNERTSDRPPMSLAVFVAWMLDLNATTPEVVKEVRKQDFTISGATFDGGTFSTLHWAVTDAEGRTAIIEFQSGDINIYEAEDMPVMANDPPYPQMIAINDYWQKIGGENMLPGTVKSPDRFVRGTFFTEHVKKTSDPVTAIAIARSLMANVSVPYQYTKDTEPNVSSTQWRSYSFIPERRYYFDVVTNLGVYYIDLTKCNLKKGAPVMKFDTSANTFISGDATPYLVKSAPFTPMY